MRRHFRTSPGRCQCHREITSSHHAGPIIVEACVPMFDLFGSQGERPSHWRRQSQAWRIHHGRRLSYDPRVGDPMGCGDFAGGGLPMGRSGCGRSVWGGGQTRMVSSGSFRSAHRRRRTHIRRSGGGSRRPVIARRRSAQLRERDRTRRWLRAPRAEEVANGRCLSHTAITVHLPIATAFGRAGGRPAESGRSVGGPVSWSPDRPADQPGRRAPAGRLVGRPAGRRVAGSPGCPVRGVGRLGGRSRPADRVIRAGRGGRESRCWSLWPQWSSCWQVGLCQIGGQSSWWSGAGQEVGVVNHREADWLRGRAIGGDPTGAEHGEHGPRKGPNSQRRVCVEGMQQGAYRCRTRGTPRIGSVGGPA